MELFNLEHKVAIFEEGSTITILESTCVSRTVLAGGTGTLHRHHAGRIVALTAAKEVCQRAA